MPTLFIFYETHNLNAPSALRQGSWAFRKETSSYSGSPVLFIETSVIRRPLTLGILALGLVLEGCRRTIKQGIT